MHIFKFKAVKWRDLHQVQIVQIKIGLNTHFLKGIINILHLA